MNKKDKQINFRFLDLVTGLAEPGITVLYETILKKILPALEEDYEEYRGRGDLIIVGCDFIQWLKGEYGIEKTKNN